VGEVQSALNQKVGSNPSGAVDFASRFIIDKPRMVVLNVKIVQEYTEPKVEMYKPIWGLVFKCNGSGIQFNSTQFSQEYSNKRNMRKEKKR
jgi:hypothetical protein